MFLTHDVVFWFLWDNLLYFFLLPQVKFSELTMDMFRMLQTLEREPQEDYNHLYESPGGPGRVPFVSDKIYPDIHTDNLKKVGVVCGGEREYLV